MVAPARERFARECVIASPDNPRMRLAILGFGLIGGSVARALRDREPGNWTIAAWSPAGTGARQAASEGFIDLAAPDARAAITGADLVLLAAPPLACLALLDDLAGPLRSALGREAIVTDVASTKRQIVTRARELEVRFVGGHPMAGREASGFGAADGSLFAARPWVICPPADQSDEAAVAAVERLARATGAVPIRLEPEVHDAAVAAISHLPLVVSAALVEANLGESSGLDEPTRAAASGLAATGWRDMTRLARGDEAIGAGIAATNADHLAGRLRALRDELDAWLTELERSGGPDPVRLQARFAAARRLAGGAPGQGSDDGAV
jgi:prephenate dehydrogenase